MKMWPRHDLENKVTSHEPKVIEASNLRLPGYKLEMQLYAKIGSLSETELGPAKKTTWGVASPQVRARVKQYTVYRSHI